VNYVIVGYGKMGRAIDVAATARDHSRVALVDRSSRVRGSVRHLADAAIRGTAVAFEFTEPAAAHAHVVELLRRNIGVVCGTTGWDAADPDVRRAAKRSRAGAVIAPNFSVGMNLFYAVVQDAAARYLAVGDYEPWIAEWHHAAKRDTPSGTAKRLAALLRDGGAREVPTAAVRAGREPGRHVVGFDGPHDAIRLEHAARGREGFALGAVLAAEWIRRKRGVHGFDEVLDDLIRGRGRRRQGRR
jgi:4-hydroxy-tetrahydrodipicolinate reductase